MKYNGFYFWIFKSPMKKVLTEKYSREYATNIMKKSKRVYRELVEKADVIGDAWIGKQAILLPLVNPKGFFAGVKQLNPADGKNLNREFPGEEDGTETQRMAWVIEKLLYPEADFLLDLHGGDWNEELAPLVFFPCGAGQTVEQETRRAARQNIHMDCGSWLILVIGSK